MKSKFLIINMLDNTYYLGTADGKWVYDVKEARRFDTRADAILVVETQIIEVVCCVDEFWFS